MPPRDGSTLGESGGAYPIWRLSLLLRRDRGSPTNHTDDQKK